MKRLDLSKYETMLKDRVSKPPDFPSYRHQIAWNLAVYFNEPYSYWVRMVGSTSLLAGQVVHEWEVLQGKPFTRRQRARMLLRSMFPK